MLKTYISKPLLPFQLVLFPVTSKLQTSYLCSKKDHSLACAITALISLISVFSKLLEKLIYNRLIKFVKKNKSYLKIKLYGFRAKHSTDHAILCIIDKIQKTIDDQSYSCSIFLDFTKAFDTVNHQILIKRLGYYGI